MSELQNISCSCSSFAELRRSNSIYVDKTALVYRIASHTAFNSHFISRPRRFGKSLLCSTFKALFLGQRSLFDGLAISDMPWKWEEETRPVLSISMPAVSDLEDFKSLFRLSLEELAVKYKVNLVENEPVAAAFRRLIGSMADKSRDGKIAVIIDEYDAPLLHCPESMRHEMKMLLAAVYGQLKDCGDRIRFVFITGITKFTKISIFSQLNNFEDMSLKVEYETLLGYTRDEIQGYFMGHIQNMARELGLTFQDCYDELTRRYDGFRFTESPERLFNPFSLANVLVDKRMRAYWASSGTPSFLADEMRRRQWIPSFVYGETTCCLSDLESFDIEVSRPELLLFQTGYLTIKDVRNGNGILGEPEFILDYPNIEVRAAMLKSFYDYLDSGSGVQVNTYAEKLREAAYKNDLQGVLILLKSHLDAIPGCDSEVIRHYEGYYQTIITTILQMACCRMDGHQQGNLGIQDAAIYSADTIYIFELKVDGTPEEAIQQCLTKNYAGKYVRDGRRIILVGLSCDSRTRSIDIQHCKTLEYNAKTLV